MKGETIGRIVLSILFIVGITPFLMKPSLLGASLWLASVFITGFLITLIAEKPSWKVWLLWPLAIVSDKYTEWISK